MIEPLPATRTESPWWGLGLAASAIVVTLPALLVQGGVAAIVVAAGVAIALALPAALWVPNVPTAPSSRRTEWAGLTAASGSAVAMAGFTLVPVTGPWIALAVLASAFAVVLALSPRLPVPVWAGGLLLAGLVAAFAGDATPWGNPATLMLPRWATAPQWAPASVVLGAALALSAAQWQPRQGRPRPREQRRVPFVLGAALVGVAVSTVLFGVDHAASHLARPAQAAWLPTTSAWWIGALGVIAATTTIGSPYDPATVRRARWVLGWSVWFGIGGPHAINWLWTAILPLGAAGLLLSVAVQLQDARRLLPGTLGVSLLAATAAGFSGIPEHAYDAFFAAATVVGMAIAVGWNTDEASR